MPSQPYSNVLQMIGHTPLIAVSHIDTGPCQLFLKLENQNPGGSIKDRIGLYLIEAAERQKKIKPGDLIRFGSVEAMVCSSDTLWKTVRAG